MQLSYTLSHVGARSKRLRRSQRLLGRVRLLPLPEGRIQYRQEPYYQRINILKGIEQVTRPVNCPSFHVDDDEGVDTERLGTMNVSALIVVCSNT